MPSARLRWSYKDEVGGWKGYDERLGLRYDRETIDAMSKTYEHWNTIMDEYDMDIDSQDERALNIMRRERSDPTYAPDEPVPMTLKPFDGAPGSSEGVIKYTYMKELTTVSEVIEDVSEYIGAKVYEISLVRAGVKMSQKQWTLSDYGVKADYVVYYKVDHVTVY